jgi:uncharacterized protein Usg
VLTCSGSQQELIEEYEEKQQLVSRASILGYSLATAAILLQLPRYEEHQQLVSRVSILGYSLATVAIILQLPRYEEQQRLVSRPAYSATHSHQPIFYSIYPGMKSCRGCLITKSTITLQKNTKR